EELEIKAFIHEYNRTEGAKHRIMAYWTRPGFGLLEATEENTQVAYCASKKVDVTSNFLPIKQLALDLLHGFDENDAFAKFQVSKELFSSQRGGLS
ncbi:unnamed protein product, partial [Symbiodinium necroappetens]